MSGIAGVWHRDGAPVDRSTPRRMLDAIAHRGPDASDVWCHGPIGFAHTLLRTTPESVFERQPLVCGDVAIVFDGRIDNREEIAEALARDRIEPPAAFDAAFALAAYDRWGADCAVRLLGDFAFAIWDRARQTLFCARDIIGLKPFYYHAGRARFAFGSELTAVLQHPFVTRQPNEGMVGEYLSVITTTSETLFADVQRLPRASHLTVSRDRCRVAKYWDPDPALRIRYRDVAEYSAQLRSLLREAVRVRLRSCSTVGVMLSGGVDSSSVTAMATSLAREGLGNPCETFSLVAPGTEMDESRYIDQVVEMNGCVGHKFALDTPPAAEYRLIARSRSDAPPWPNARLACTLRRTARERGSRVLLSGLWGDEWFGGSYYDCADLFRSLRWRSLAAKVRTQRRYPEVPRPGPLVKLITWPLLPYPVRKQLKMLIGRDGVPKWVRSDFARRICLADRLYPADSGPRFPTVVQWMIYRDSTSGAVARGTEEEDRAAAEAGIETRHPFADRRILEFALALPEDLRWRNGVRKFILRSAMREYLPEPVAQRLTSPEAGPVLVAPIRQFVAAGFLDELRLAERGWVDAREARRLFDTTFARHRAADPTCDFNPLWMIASSELWLQEAVEREAGEEQHAWRAG